MEKKPNTFVLSILCIVVLFLAMFPFLFLLGKISSSDEKIVSQLPFPGYRETVILSETEDMGQEYIDSIVFLGESTTFGLWKYGVLSQGSSTTQVWTGASWDGGRVQCSGTLSLSPAIASTKIYYPETREAITVSEAIFRKKPQFLIITLGLNNGASYYSEEQFKQCYRILLDSVEGQSQGTVIVLQSLFPVSRACTISAYTPQRIEQCNFWIRDIAEEYNLKYLNTISALSDEQGYLKPEYDNGGDGIHLNELGLREVLYYIRTHGYVEESFQ